VDAIKGSGTMELNIQTSARLAVAATSLITLAVFSADHAESPAADADPAADIADVFIFPSRESAGKLVGAITFGGRPAPRSRIDTHFYCDPRVLYAFHIDRADANGVFDSIPDVTVYARLASNRAGQCAVQLENVPGAGGTFSGPIEQVFATPSGIKAFAGLRNDPFFFDAQGLTALFASFATPGQNGDLVTAFGIGTRARRDSFGNRNISAIVFDMDLDALAPRLPNGSRPQLRAWAVTSRLAG
jgi:hypothetical protein